MDPFLYVQEEYDNVARSLAESLRYDYGPGQTVEYYAECQFRLERIREELEQLRESGAGPTSVIVAQLWDLANRLTLIERSHLGEFSWPFADAIREIATSLLSEDEGLTGKIDPIIHMIAEGTSYQILSEKILGPNKRRRLYTVAFPRQLKHHVLMHALFGHELGHATFYSSRRTASLFSGAEPPSKRIIGILRREGPLKDASSTMAWLRSEAAPDQVRERMARSTGVLTETNLGHWLVELVCDLFGLAIFGPSFAAAHRTYLEPSCRTPYEFEIEKTSHPAYALRRNALIGGLRTRGWLTPVCMGEDPQTLEAENAFIEYIGADNFGSWSDVFTDDQLNEALTVISEHFIATGTQLARRPDEGMLVSLVNRIVRHLPPIREDIDDEGTSRTYATSLEEQLYAGWTYWLGRKTFQDEQLTFFQLNQLCDLALLQQQAIDLCAGRREL